jgi:hypothetical protein
MLKNSLFVLSLVFSIFGKCQTYENGTNLFDNSIVHRIDVTFTQSNYWDSLEYYYNQGLENGTDVTYLRTIVSIDGNVFDSVGFKEKGYFSNWGAMPSVKKPFKINLSKYKDGQKYDGLKKINLSNGFLDPSMMHDALAYKFMRDAGIPAPRTAYTKVYLNGTYWGLYILVEELDKNFLQNWYANKEGNLFKCINNTSLAWQGSTFSSYTDEFELQTNSTANDWSQFTRFVDIINNSGTHFIDSLPMVLDVQNYLNVLAADVIMFNWDSYYDHGRNFFLYDDPDENKINWLPWDYNLAFSNSETNLIIDYSGEEPQHLVQKIQANPTLRTMYFNSLCILMDNYFTNSNLDGFIDQTHDLIRPDLALDNNKFFTISEFDANMTTDVNSFMGAYRGLKTFISDRQTSISNQLNAYNHTCSGLSVDENTLVNFEIYPNPFETSFTVHSEKTLESIVIFSITGQKIIELTPQSQEEVISLEKMEKGTYFVRVQSNGIEKTLTVIKN